MNITILYIVGMFKLLKLICSLRFRIIFFFFKQKTAYEMRISDWSSDVCSSDLADSQVDELDADERRDETAKPIDGNDRKSVVKGKSVSVRVDFGGRRSIKTEKK